MTLTDQQRQLVTESFAHLVPISNEATTVFYNRLWALAPETRALFATTDMSVQGNKLMQTLGMSVRALHDLNEIAPLLHELGVRHIGYGVTKEQYRLVETALLAMIEHCMGADFTPEIREAWVAAYALIAEMTMRAYEQQ